MWSNAEEDQLSYLKCNPNSDGLREVRSDEAFKLQCVLAPFEAHLYSEAFGFWPTAFICIRGGLCSGGKGLMQQEPRNQTRKKVCHLTA